ncbi:unnamed protein product [Triticum turgidum subsp. durum]|uniref:Uncharacterized protein n=1 Tax=Triticum turgidum subsp. durum TaxID=4567 RepID=A0A9R0UWD9_TRITD|nr:unnamed protein product [Triticum turgidum subsp. durum]
MGISFKLSKVGVRVQPTARSAAPELPAAAETEKPGAGEKDGSRPEAKREDAIVERANDANGIKISPACSRAILPDHEVSFTFSLYDRGYLIAKSAVLDPCQPSVQDGKTLHPYDRASEKLFSAIEAGRLPGDILDEIPSKYYNGSVICEIRDYRKHASNQVHAPSADLGLPAVNKVQLQMTFENVVRDIMLLSDDSWSYRDFMEAESRIVKALQPALCLDPTPKLDRLCQDPVPHKLNLGVGRKRRLRQNPDVVVTSSYMSHGKKVCIDRVSESTKTDEMGIASSNITHQVLDNITSQIMSGGSQPLRPSSSQDAARMSMVSHSGIQQNINYNAVGNDHGAGGPVSFTGVNSSTSSQNMMAYNDNGLLSVKRELQEAPLQDPKRVKPTISTDDIQQQQQRQQIRPQSVALSGQDMQWKKGMQYASLNGQRYPSPMVNNMQDSGASFYFREQGLRYGAKQEQMDGMERCKDPLQAMPPENTVLDQQQPHAQHLSQQAAARNNLQNMAQWQNPRGPSEKDMKKEEMLQRRKLAAASRVSSAPMVQSPVSSKSGEISSSSMGGQFGSAATSAAIGSHKDNKFATSSSAAVGYPSVVSSPSDSMHRMQQPSVAPSKRKNSAPKTQPLVSSAGSPASVSNMLPIPNASSPSVGTSMADQSILEKFRNIEAISNRHQLHNKKNKVDNLSNNRKSMINASREKVVTLLSNCFHTEDYKDELRPLCNSMLNGTINSFRTRILNFVVTNRSYQGPTKPFRIIFKDKPDGTVGMQYGDPEDFDNRNSHECTLILPTKYHADLLATQLIARMEKEGYDKADDQVVPSNPPGNLSGLSGMLPDNTANEVKQEGGITQQLNAAAHANMVSGSPLQQLSANRMLPSGSSNQAVPMQQGYMQGATMSARSQQLDQSLIQQQQQQQPQLQQNAQSQLQQQTSLPLNQMQRPQLLPTSPLSQMLGPGSNLPMGSNHMSNTKATTPASLQLHMMQQAQQQQPVQMSRKVMMGPGSSVNMGNMVNNVVGLSGLGNIMGMGNVRPMSSPMGSMSGLGNSPNQMSLGMASNLAAAGLRPGMNPAAIAKMRMGLAQQQRVTSLYPQTGMVGLPGSGSPILPSSAGLAMMGHHSLNRNNLNPMQRAMMSPMGPPKMPVGNFQMNAQQHSSSSSSSSYNSNRCNSSSNSINSSSSNNKWDPLCSRRHK